MGDYQAYQHTNNCSPRMTEEIERGRKNIQRHNGQKHPKFDERYEPTHLKRSRNSK